MTAAVERGTVAPVLVAALVFALLIGAGLSLFSCDDDDGVDESEEGSTPQNGWSEGCNWGYDGSELPAGEDGCLPPRPGRNNYYDMLADMFDVYGGTYVDQDGQTIEITCRPEGAWSVPEPIAHPMCMYDWIIPVWVTFAESEKVCTGSIDQMFPSFDVGAQIGYSCGGEEDGAHGGRHGKVDGEWYWTLSNDDRWTKVE